MPAPRTMRILALTAALAAGLGAAVVAPATASAAAPITDDRDPSCTTTSTTALCAAPDTLLDVRIGDVHPTQPSLGYDEVYYKLGRYSTALSKDAVNKKFDDWCEANGQEEAATTTAASTLTDPSTFTCAVPVGSETPDTIAPMKTVVIGPGGTLYLTDGHHTLTSFDEDSGPDVHVRLRVLGNLSGLGTTEFWQTMQDNRWVWLRDTAGRSITPARLPQNVGLAAFQDDSARSIMYFGRDIGYTADGAVPFQEFYWGSWLRAHPELGLASWDQDDFAASLSLVERITRAQVALAPNDVVDAESGYTAADLSTLSAWNDGKAVTKGEWAKLSAPYSSDKPGKLAYMTEYRRTLAAEPGEPGTDPSDPSDPTDPTEPTDPADPGTTPTEPAEPSTTPSAPSDPSTGDDGPTDPTTVRGTVTVEGDLVAGGSVTVHGTGFAADTAARVEIHSDPVLLGAVRTDDTGAFTLAATVPTSLPAGTHTVVVVVDGVTVGSTTVTVAAAGPDGELAFTGAEGLVPAAVTALLAVLVGTGIVVARRRRARRA
ncbi:hypothetical protein JOE58_003288 [Curtobacterium luteum]|uniref:Chromosome partitioning protein ParB n=1 Tax=Curtobacterium luteum TaxID=33881 RepID=A0A8H9GA63_9MICO|nr:ParB/Srx family N-terminal domain-containing protein [Curtobacterium luteum]MBM7804037.1 hypothetical protein [Curtobacterium luteum]GGK97183.1 hypothetical protein GCM10009769_14200 [Curtobacterium luteum]